MIREVDGELRSYFCHGCRNKGDFRGAVRPKNLDIQANLAGASIHMATSLDDRGHEIKFSADMGDIEDPCVGELLTQIRSGQQLRELGRATCARIGICDVDKKGECEGLTLEGVVEDAQKILARGEHLDRAAEF